MKDNKVTIRIIGILLILFLLLCPVSISQTGRIVSPEILPDNRVTFRLFANEANSIAVTGEWMQSGISENLVRNDTGLWSVTIGPLARAISGLSMGGRHAMVIGLNNLGLFSSVSILSAAESLDLTIAVCELDFNSKEDLLFVGAGTNETQPGSRHEVLHEEFNKLNIKHEYYVGGNGAYDFITWWHLLYYEFLPGLWRN